jgi:hypothetical protein
MEPRNSKYHHLGTTTAGDALAAYLTFMGARSFFFWVLLIGMLVIQSAFWAVDRGFVDAMLPGMEKNVKALFVRADLPDGVVGAVLTSFSSDRRIERVLSSKESNPSSPAEPPESGQKSEPVPQWNKSQLAQSLHRLIRTGLAISYYVMTFSAVLYCLTLLGGMNLSVVGRLNGLADSAKAFFLSLVLMVLIVPWTCVFDPNIFVTLYSFRQLSDSYLALRRGQGADLPMYVCYYGRFVGLWVVSLIILLTAHSCSRRAARTALVEMDAAPVDPARRPENNAI